MCRALKFARPGYYPVVRVTKEADQRRDRIVKLSREHPLYGYLLIRCSVPLLDWTGDKPSELVQDQAHIHPAQKLCEGAAQVSPSVARRGRSAAVAELLRGRRHLPLVAVHPQSGAFCHE